MGIKTMNNTLTVIIPVSKNESIETIQNSIDRFSTLDYSGFDAKIVYCIDLPEDIKKYCDGLKIMRSVIEILWATDNDITKSGNYNTGINKYPESDYYALFDIGSFPEHDFFQKTVKINADFVTSDQRMPDVHKNSISKTMSEENEMTNTVRRLSMKYTGKCFTRGASGLINGVVFRTFRFTSIIGNDNEFYTHLIKNGFSFGYATDTHFNHKLTWRLKDLWNQRLRWQMLAWKLSIERSSIGLDGIITTIGMTFPIVFVLALPFLIKDVKHIRGYNILFHLLFLQAISLITLIKVIKNDRIKWRPKQWDTHQTY